mmetsp:Transcript_14081/g.49583  ORF Transcript_14081/g.49583 Transcript_14081/m.49583 type:complete len:241 (+) Transcript_14081:429-1151(+)
MPRGHDEIYNISKRHSVRQVTFRSGHKFAQRNAGASQDEQRRQEEGQQPLERACEDRAQFAHGAAVLGTACFPVPAETQADVALRQIVVQAMVQDDQLRPLPSIAIGTHSEVDIPCVRICVHPSVNEDHLCKSTAKQPSALQNIQTRAAKSLCIVRLDEPIAELHGQDTLGSMLPIDCWHIDARREVSQLGSRQLSVRRLELEVELASYILLKILNHPHEVIALRHLLHLASHGLEHRKV